MCPSELTTMEKRPSVSVKCAATPGQSASLRQGLALSAMKGEASVLFAGAMAREFIPGRTALRAESAYRAAETRSTEKGPLMSSTVQVPVSSLPSAENLPE